MPERGLDADVGGAPNEVVFVPFSEAELTVRLARLAEAGCRPPRVEQAALVIDHDAHDVILGDRAVHLTPREHAVLACLARYGGRVVTVETLVAACAQVGSEVNERSLAVIMSRIRRRLGLEARHIETLRGLGYRLS